MGAPMNDEHARVRDRSITEATLPAALRVPFDQWSAVQDRRMLSLPMGSLGHCGLIEIVNGRCYGPGVNEVEMPGPGRGWLLYHGRVGQDVIAAWDEIGFGSRAGLIRCGRLRRIAEIRMPKSFQLEFLNWFVWSRLSAIRTAELAVLTLRERKAPRRKDPEPEAWLRRQLEGLGKEGSS
jgi:hypothetical protein